MCVINCCTIVLTLKVSISLASHARLSASGVVVKSAN